ncbi:hypothetical protein BD410DRAFT_693022, partial [Rickenella mellea]
DPSALAASQNGPPLRAAVERDPQFLTGVRVGYQTDALCSKIIAAPDAYSSFSIDDGLLFSKNHFGDPVLVLPRSLLDGRSIPEIVIDSAHSVLGHLGFNKTAEYIRRWYWW